MNEDGSLFGPIFVDELHTEPSRELEVELDSCELPSTADRILDLHVDFRSIKSPVSFLETVLDFIFLEGELEIVLCLVPGGNFSEETLRSG